MSRKFRISPADQQVSAISRGFFVDITKILWFWRSQPAYPVFKSVSSSPQDWTSRYQPPPWTTLCFLDDATSCSRTIFFVCVPRALWRGLPRSKGTEGRLLDLDCVYYMLPAVLVSHG